MIFGLLKSGYNKIKEALAKTRSFLGSKLRALFSGPIDASTLEKLEQLFYEADLGVQTAQELTEKVRSLHEKDSKLTSDQMIDAIKKDLVEILLKTPSQLISEKINGPTVILIVGVNGNGKTTSVAKLANLFQSEGKKVILGAADTFRAAATEQLSLWAGKLEVDIVKGQQNSDPASVAFDTIHAAKARGADIAIIDTAGRLHTKTNLMVELDKIRRTCGKLSTNAPHETLLVLDATTGQNAIDQAKTFHQHTPITGLILTKLDGTAKGGIVISIYRQLGIPIKFIGLGEGIEDLQPFDAKTFVSALFD